MNKQTQALKLALEAAYLAGFNASGEGYNGEYPFGDKNQNPEADAVWVKDRDNSIREALAEQPEFTTHSVEQPYDWSEWVCPDPKGYLMKCCDCGLVHEVEFAVVRYKSEAEREDCDMVDDPNLQAVFRMRRSEQWSPEDTAHRAGGLPMAEQPAQQQEPVAFDKTEINCFAQDLYDQKMREGKHGHYESMFHVIHQCIKKVSPPASKPLTLGQKQRLWSSLGNKPTLKDRVNAFGLAIEAAHGIKGNT